MKTIAIKNQIMDTLQWSSEEYDDRLFQSYFNYCVSYGSYPANIQQLLANSKLNKWFLKEYAKAEVQFLKIAEVVPPTKVDFLRGQYKACTAEVMKLYSKPLIDVRRNKAFSSVLFDRLVTFSN